MPRVATPVMSEGLTEEDEEIIDEDEETFECSDCGAEVDSEGPCEDCTCECCGDSLSDCECLVCHGCQEKSNSQYNTICEICDCVCCCECPTCQKCGDKVDPENYCFDCDVCNDCGCFGDEDGDMQGEYGKSETAPWIGRGLTIQFSDLRTEANLPITGDDRYNRYWKLENDKIDPARAMCDFYLLEGVASMVFNGFNGIRDDLLCSEIAQQAQSKLDAHVEWLDKTFVNYADMAIGGELRYHKAVGGSAIERGSRTAAWVDWFLFRQKAGVEALAEAAQLFREIGKSGIGGEAWAVATDILYARLTGKMDKRTFVDRVFTLQHNGGMFINKVTWHQDNRPHWDYTRMTDVIGPAHSHNPTQFHILLAACSNDVTAVFNEWWRASNVARRAAGLPMTPRPSWRDHMVLSSSRPHYPPRPGFDVSAAWKSPLFDLEWIETMPPRPFRLPGWWTSQHSAVTIVCRLLSDHRNMKWAKGDVGPMTDLDVLVENGYMPEHPVPHDNVYGYYLGSSTVRWLRWAYDKLIEVKAEFPDPTEDDMLWAAAIGYHSYSEPLLWDLAQQWCKRHKLRVEDYFQAPTYHGYPKDLTLQFPWAVVDPTPKKKTLSEKDYPLPPLTSTSSMKYISASLSNGTPLWKPGTYEQYTAMSKKYEAKYLGVEADLLVLDEVPAPIENKEDQPW